MYRRRRLYIHAAGAYDGAMKARLWLLNLWASIAIFGAVTPGQAEDFGNPTEVAQVRKTVAAKFGHALHASVSKDWALCTAYGNESDLSVVLHRADKGWKVIASDGGAYDAGTLKSLGVPATEIPSLLRAYQ